ncbi:MAG TPA: hypothetical protein VFV67_30565 [Actinophytocola sp.]|uniref:hypothetical protein n=1 Tax=Actinophytocola sp. TaxID=1872138 RepID=UPI002DBCD1CA|nr:hypothetical protein [Actinophytocola sp.]HEU5475008.1 hypothetical protein [Actinophytocola sp.]
MSAPHPPGQPPWPGLGGGGEETTPLRGRGEPVQFRAEPPARQQNPALLWVLRGLGLLAVAVISGLTWYYLNDEAQPAPSAATPTEEQRTGQFTFTPVPEVAAPRHDSNCAEHAYDKVKAFLQSTPCQQLTRGLYTTTSQDGRKVYASVSVVRMASDADAAQLRELADKDNTGNVNDLVREGIVKLPPLNSLSGGGGYHAVQHGQNVIIVEADFAPGTEKGDKKKDEDTLDTICVDATLLGDRIGA